MRFARSPRFACFLVALLFASAIVVQWRAGADATPAPIRESMAFLFGIESPDSARLIVALEIAIAAAVLVAGTRVLAVAATIGFAFVSLACVSAAFRQGGLLLPMLGLAASATLLAVAARARRTPAAGTTRHGLSPAWPALAAMVAGTAAANLASGLSFRTDPVSEAEAKAKAMSIDLDMRPYIGKPLSESPIGTYLPSVVARVGAETAFIVFYNPHCDACHNLFEASFGEPRSELVVAVEIPPPKDAVIAAHDELGPITCVQCEFESLPPGPVWLVAPPMTVKVVNGVITCVADRFGGDCINPQ